MADSLADFNGWTDDRIRDAAGFLTSAQVDSAVTAAVEAYERVRARVLVVSTSGDGGYDYATPAGWETDFSMLIQIEYPAGEQRPSILEGDRYTLYNDASTGERIRFLAHTPDSAETFIVTFSARHTVDGSTSTIRPTDDYAVADLAAAIALRQLGARTLESQDSTIGADAVDYGGASARYSAAADRYLRSYRTHMGLGKAGADTGAGDVAAVAYLDVDPALPWGEQRLFHGRDIT
jgi:hypothetical protein|tara:strand:- start:339 stop:1046 length:708 start_codon:yes stop_codon:yes gene_type:complete